jgi:nitroimidazol reductase NimA-like FMN-containing flavoprotein (pyridoxamine 5'-phosphate oxidase superfamily)
MPPSTVRDLPSATSAITTEECLEVLGRVCFGHLAFFRDRHIRVQPIRYAFHEGWVFFRADSDLRAWIARSPWLALSVTEVRDSAHTSVVVRGGCYPAEGTGSARGDADAHEGVVALRDRPRVGPRAIGRQERKLSVFRLRAEDVHGSVTMVPCPAGQRPYDDAELEHLRAVSRAHTQSDDSRADDDGMAAPSAPEVRPTDASARTR